MAQVTITVNGRDHRIGCGDGEEDRVRELAAIVDEKATAMARQIGPSSDSRLLLMTAIVMADDLSLAQAALADKGGQAAENPSPDEIRRIKELAARLENIAEQAETA